MAQGLAEVFQSILLFFRAKRCLDDLLLFEILVVLLGLLVAQVGVKFEVLTCHAEETSLAPLCLAFSLHVSLGQITIYLRLLSLLNCLSLLDLVVKSHLGQLGLSHYFFLGRLARVRIERAVEVAVAVVEQVTRVGDLSCRFTVFVSLVTHIDQGCVTGPEWGLASVVEVQFVLVDYPIHELVALTRPRKRLLYH